MSEKKVHLSVNGTLPEVTTRLQSLKVQTAVDDIISIIRRCAPGDTGALHGCRAHHDLGDGWALYIELGPPDDGLPGVSLGFAMLTPAGYVPVHADFHAVS